MALAEWADRLSHSVKAAFMMAQCNTCCGSNRLANSHEQHPAVGIASISMTAGPEVKPEVPQHFFAKISFLTPTSHTLQAFKESTPW
jgi:hypothetical protein